ncbi:hypothetical protein H4217_003937 [Coemansia sp. RSA 1939]|nr:hypothetical protein H4217_003937 [Coemansia sp. RSA 1939]
MTRVIAVVFSTIAAALAVSAWQPDRLIEGREMMPAEKLQLHTLSTGDMSPITNHIGDKSDTVEKTGIMARKMGEPPVFTASGKDGRFSPYTRSTYDTRGEDHYSQRHYDSRDGEDDTASVQYSKDPYSEHNHEHRKTRSRSRSRQARRGYYDRDAVDTSDMHVLGSEFTSSPQSDSRMGAGSEHRPRGRGGGAPTRGRERGRGRGLRGRGGGMSGDWSTSREWSADHSRYPIDEGADYGFSTSANSTDFKYDDEYTDGTARGNQFRGSRYRMDDDEAGQRHNTRDMYCYDNENMESRFGGGRGGHGFQGKYGNHYGSLPLAGEDQRHWQNSGPSGQRGYFKDAQSRSNSDHGPMYANRSRSDNGPDGASNAGRYKRNIPIAPKDKDVNRTIFMRAPSETVVHSDDIAEWFSRFGEVADVCNLIGRSGICYVMFYDSRCVQQVLKSAGSHIRISGVHLSLQPSRHRPDAIGRRPNPEDYQASVLLSLEGSKTMHGFTESDRAQFEEDQGVYEGYRPQKCI